MSESNIMFAGLHRHTSYSCLLPGGKSESDGKLDSMNYIYALIDPRTQGIRYIGITIRSLKARLRGHVHQARSGEANHRSAWIRSLLKEDLRPIIILIEETEDRNRESYWIGYYRTAGLDLTNGTNGGDGGYTWTEEARERLSKSVTGFRHTEKTKAKIAEASRVRWEDPEHRAKFSAKMIGRELAPETRAKIGTAHLGKQWRLGQTNSAEHRAKISEGNKGKHSTGTPHTEETKARLREKATGRQHSAETRQKISAIQTGKTRGPFSEEHIQHLRDAWVARKTKATENGQ